MELSNNIIKLELKNNIKLLIESRETESAKALLHQYKKMVPEDIEIYSIEAILEIINGNLDNSLKVIKEGLFIDANNADLLYNLAYVHEMKGDFNKALKYYDFAYRVAQEEMKVTIKEIMGNLIKSNNIIFDIEEYLKANKSNEKSKRVLILCNFYSPYVKSYMEKIKEKYNVVFDVFTVKSEDENDIRNNGYYKFVELGIINRLHTYKYIHELDNLLNNSEKYDVTHIHFLESFYNHVANTIRNKCEVLITTIWGSDFYRTSDKDKTLQKEIINNSDLITFDNEVVKDEFIKYFGENLRKRCTINRFGLTALEHINDIESISKEKIKAQLQIPSDAIVVQCGYNAKSAHNHLQMIDSIISVKNKLPKNMFYIFPMTYGKIESYMSQVKNKLEKSGLNYKIIEDFMQFDDIAKLTKCTDIMVHLQTTDTLSATMQEHIYNGNVIITGSWLPYKPLKDVGTYFIEVDSVNKLGKTLLNIVNNLNEYKIKCLNNKKIIWNFSSWEKTANEWIKNYEQSIKIFKEKNVRRKALIIAYFFPPLGGAGVQRTLKYVKYLREFGWEPVVVTVGNSNYFAKDASLRMDIPSDIEVIRIDDVINEEFSNEFLNKLVKFYAGVVNNDELMKQYISELNKSNTSLQQLALIPNFYSAWGCKVINCIENKINFDDIDLIYTTSSPECDHLIGYYLKKKYNLPWTADFRDEWTNNPYVEYDTNSIKYKIERSMERNIVNLADKVITITSIATNNYIKLFNLDRNKVETVTNGYDEDDFKGIDLNIKTKSNKFTITHNGLFYGIRTPITFLTALSNLIEKGLIDKNKIEVCFTRTSGDDNLKEFINSNDLNRVVKCLDYLNHKESLKLCCKTNLLLLVIGSGEKCKSVFTGKIFEYLRLGKPILALAPRDGVVDELLKETRRGRTVDYEDVNEIEKNLLNYYQEWNEGKTRNYNLDSTILRYDRKNLTKKMTNIFNELNKNININFVENNNMKKLFDTKDYNDIINIIEKYIGNRDFETAIDICKHWLVNVGNSAVINYFLGVCYNCIKDFEKAIKHHSYALKLDKSLGDIKDKKYEFSEFYDESKIECIGCGCKDYDIVWVGNQSLMYSNYGVVNPLRIWVQCKKCGLVYANPQPSEKSFNMMSEKLAEEETANKFGNLDEQFEWQVSVANNRLKNIERYCQNKNSLLDIGAGYGLFAGIARDRGWNITALEFTKHDCVYAKDNFDLDLIEKNFYDFNESEKFDVVTLFEVIEHLRTPLKDLKRINKLLNLNGILVIATPNLTSLYCRKYKENNRFWYMAVHLSFFSRKVLVEYGEKAGFKVIESNVSQEGGGRMELYFKKVNEID